MTKRLLIMRQNLNDSHRLIKLGNFSLSSLLFISLTQYAFAVTSADLKAAIESGDPTQAEAVITCKPSLANDLLKNSSFTAGLRGSYVTPLILATFQGNLPMVRLLITHGARIDQGTLTGSTPLSTAIESGHDDIALELIDSGANLQGQCGAVALKSAIRVDNMPLIRKLIEEKGVDFRYEHEASSEISALNYATSLGKMDFIQYLVEKGAIPDVRTLMESLKHPAILTYLLEHFDSLTNSKQESGTTALGLACRRGDLISIRILLDHGADLNIKDNDGKTPFDYFMDATRRSLARFSLIDVLQIHETFLLQRRSTCPLCFEDFKVGNNVMQTPCDHLFHEECFKPWFISGHHNCPICRTGLDALPDSRGIQFINGKWLKPRNKI